MASIWFAVVFLNSSFGWSGENVSCPDSARKYLSVAETALEPPARLNLIRKAIANCPKNARAYYLLGLHYQALGLRSEASVAYRSALDRLPEAKSVLREIRQLNPRTPKDALWNVIGKLIPLKERGNSGDPESWSIEDLMKKVPNDYETRLFLAKELTGIGQDMMSRNRAGGLPLLVRAIELVPKYQPPRNFLVQYFWNLGEYHFNGEWYDKAVMQYRKGLVYAPNNPRLHLKLAETYSRMQNHENDSLRHYRHADAFFAQRAIAISGNEQASIRQRIQRGLDRYDDSRPAYRKKRSDAARELGKTYLAKEDYGRAAAAFKEAVGWTPGNALLHFDLAAALKEKSDPESDRESLQHFERSLVLFRTAPPPDAANLEKRFEKRIQLEIAHLTGESGSAYYLMQQVAIGVQERAIELSLFVLAFAGIAAYLLRAGLRISGSESEEPYPTQ